VLVRVAGRRSEPGGAALSGGTQIVYPARPDRAWRRIAARREMASLEALAPVSPAMVSRTLPTDEDTPVTIPLLPGARTPLRFFQFAVVNGCTVASLVLGMSAVFLAINGELRLAAVVLLACVVFDGCDGALARKFGVASPFGAQMDSLADLSSFGVATGLVSYEWLIAAGASPMAAGPACAILAVCAAIRLARFNVSPKNGRFFCGVPTTMAAAVLALNMLIGPDLPANLEALIIAGCAIAMVTSFPYAKLVSVLRLPLWFWVGPAVVAMISVPAAFALVVGVYLVSGPLVWAYQHRPAVLTNR